MEDLNKTHYGLDSIKERIAEYVAIKKLNKNIKSPIICLVGPPGVGKTSIAMSIAKALNRKFYKISVGGLNDSTELIGSRRTYLASNPGKIIQGINKCGTNNPVLLIDEVDKMVKDYKGDPASTLLEILDQVQNKYFIDNYIEVPFDLSNVLFILTANDLNDIPYTLIDRVEVITINSYTIFEKKDIAKEYILPRVIEENTLSKNTKFSDEIIYYIIDHYTDEAGVRDLERVLNSLARKMAINDINSINKDKVVKLLGREKYTINNYNLNNIGTVNSLAWTPFGGRVTQTEVVEYKGNGHVTITGNIGNTMEESVAVAMSYIKNTYKESFNNIDLHIHFLEGSIKKDGTSAGLSVTVAILSLIKKKKISKDIAFTGEISLNGDIIKIGGLKEKLIGAYNKGIKTVYIPDANKDDLEDIPKIIKEKLTIIPTVNFHEIWLELFK
jgi:ATP-dependent Lon protease